MAMTRTETFEQRSAIFDRLAFRNGVVGVLRIGVPAAGVLAFVVLAGQIYIANTMRQYGVSSIKIDRGNLVVDTPQYSGTNKDGTGYTLTSRDAHAPLGDTKNITMDDAKAVLTRPGYPDLHLSAVLATADTAHSKVAIPGITTLQSEGGINGTLEAVKADMNDPMIVDSGTVALVFQDGTTLDAPTMHYDGKVQLWTFTNATLVLPNLPKDSGPKTDAKPGATPAAPPAAKPVAKP